MSYSHAETTSNGGTWTAAVTSNPTVAYHLIALRHVHTHTDIRCWQTSTHLSLLGSAAVG